MSVTISGDGTITGLSAGGLPDGTVTAADLASTLDLTGKTVTLPAGVGGKVLQVKQTIKTDNYSTTSSSFVDITGLSVSITPSSSSSKILVMFNGVISNSDSTSSSTLVRLMRDSTAICIGDASGSRSRVSSFMFTISATEARRDIGQMNNVYLDSPSTTSSITYKLQVAAGGSTAYVNRGGYDADEARVGMAASTITVMEIAA